MAAKKKPAAKKAAKPKTANKPVKRPRGRPSTFRQEVADAIVLRLSKGEPLAVICRDDGMPPVRTVSEWKSSHPEFAADFARAREEGFDAIAADCLMIADDRSRDTIIVGSGDGAHEAANTEWISRSKLRVETRLKLLAKWDPKRYGEKLAVGGADDLPPIRSETAYELSNEALAAIASGKAG